MELSRYVSSVERLLAAAMAGDEAQRPTAERLLAGLEPALRLALLDALGAAASEISRELAPGSVELRLRGGEPEFVVGPPPAEPPGELGTGSAARLEPVAGAEGELTRVNLRLPESLKARVEAAAERDGLSVNAWLVRAAAAAVERTGAAAAEPTARVARGGQRLTGWAQ